MRYYISDLHFFHESLNQRMDKRGFDSLEEMHEYMIEKWNRKVRNNDDVVILGDFSMGRGVPTNEIAKRLNGSLCLIEGNHDKFLRDRKFDSSRFEWIKPYAEMRDEKRKVVLSHYPVFCYNGQYRFDKEGNPTTYMLYGHVHDTYDEKLLNDFILKSRKSERKLRQGGEMKPIPCQMINCFCMFSDYEPLTLEEWIAVDERRRSEIISS